MVSTALIALRLSFIVTAPEAFVKLKTGLLASVEPVLSVIVAFVAVTVLGIYSIPAASFTSNSPAVCPVGILNLIVSSPTEKSLSAAKSTGDCADTPLIVCPHRVPIETNNRVKINNLDPFIASFSNIFFITKEYYLVIWGQK